MRSVVVNGLMTSVLRHLSFLVVVFTGPWLLGVDPVMPGDKVEVYSLSKWWAAEVLEYEKKKKKVKVSYEFVGKRVGEFPLNQVRFPPGESEWRSWTDASGKFKIIARLVDYGDGKATLLRQDGKRQTLPVDKLSPSNQKLVEKYVKLEEQVKEVSPVRVGDEVEYLHFSAWVPAKVVAIAPPDVSISYKDYHSKKQTKASVKVSSLRYPNGEGPWSDWQDASGKHKLKARYLTHDETSVKLMLEGNKRASIERAKLAPAIEMELKKRPILSQRPKLVDFDTTKVDLDKVPGWMVVNKDVSKVQESTLVTQPVTEESFIKAGFYSIDLTAADTQNTSQSSVNDVATNGVATNGANSSGAEGRASRSDVTYSISVIETDDPSLLIVQSAPSKNTEYDALKSYWLDLKDMSIKPGPAFFEGEFIVAYSSKESRLLTREGKNSSSGTTSYCIYEITPKARVAKSMMRWNIPEVSFAGWDKTKGVFLPDGRVAISCAGKLLLWNYVDRRLEAACDAYDGEHRLTADRNHLLVRHFSSSSFVDSKTLKPVAKVESSRSYLSNDNRHLWVNSPWKNEVVDLSTKKSLGAVSGGTRRAHQGAIEKFNVIDENYIISDGALWSLKHSIIAWSFDFEGLNELWRGVMHDHVVLMATLPKEESPTKIFISVIDGSDIAKNQYERNFEAIDYYVLKPGVAVKIDPSVTDERILSGIRQAIVKAGWLENPTSSIVITASAGPGQTVEKSYGRSPFSRNPDATFSVTPWEQKIYVSLGDLTLWGYHVGGAPSMVWVSDRSAIEAEVRKSEVPSYDAFNNFSFPEKVMHPKYSQGIGTTFVTPSGTLVHRTR